MHFQVIPVRGLTPFVAMKKNSSDTLDFASKCQCYERVRSKEVNIENRFRVQQHCTRLTRV